MTIIDDVTLRVIDALNASGVNYMLVGSFSTNVYGIPRSTTDAHFVLQLHGDFAPVFYEKLVKDFDIDPQLKLKPIQEHSSKKCVFPGRHSRSNCSDCPTTALTRRVFGGELR